MHGIAFKYLLDARPDLARGGEWDNEDRKALTRTDTRSLPGRLFGWLAPQGLREFLATRKERKHLDQAVLRLQETAPHLLDDVGLAPVAETVTAPSHEAHLALDIALPEMAEEKRPVVRLAEARGQRPAGTDRPASALPLAAE